jgi:hypothetical protein
MPTVTKANVRINSIHIHDSSATSTSEPGDVAEWFMTFTVNGQTARWSNEDVRDDTVYAVNRDFPNIDLNPNQTISIQASGYEEDSTSANDTLPTISLTLHPAEDFQLGGTRWASSPDSDEGTYSIEYTIMPAQQQALTQAREYVSVYRAGKGAHALWAGNWKSFTAAWERMSKQGLRLNRISTFRQDTGVASFGNSTERFFLGVFGAGTDGHALIVGEWKEFEAKWKELSKGGLRLVDLTPYKEGGKRMFLGVFRAGTDAHSLWVAEWPSFERKWKELSNSGFRLIALDSYKEGGKRIFTGVYRAGTDGHALLAGLDWKTFVARWKGALASGLRLIDIASYPEDGKQMFAGVFRAGSDASAMLRDDWIGFDSNWQRVSKKDLRLVAVESLINGQEE